MPQTPQTDPKWINYEDFWLLLMKTQNYKVISPFCKEHFYLQSRQSQLKTVLMLWPFCIPLLQLDYVCHLSTSDGLDRLVDVLHKDGAFQQQQARASFQQPRKFS